MRVSDLRQYFSANFRYKHCAALHLVWSDLFYKLNIRNIAGANDSGRRTPCSGDVTFGVYRRCSSAVELAIIFRMRILFTDAGHTAYRDTRIFAIRQNMIDYVCFMH